MRLEKFLGFFNFLSGHSFALACLSRPNQGQSPNCNFTTTARHSLASHLGGEAAKTFEAKLGFFNFLSGLALRALRISHVNSQ